MSQVNLLPLELRERQAIRRTSSLVVAAGLAVVALIGMQIGGVALPLLLLAYFFVLKPDGGEDLASPSGSTGITGSTGVPRSRRA